MPKREPEPPRNSDGELSSNDLDKVSGGVPGGPDVCVRPAPAGPVPIPYPNTGTAATTISDVLKEAGFD
jgi:hypothetical protein